MQKRMRIKKGDTVVVVSGADKGVKGRVLVAYPRKQRVIIEKVNMIKKHVKPSQSNPQGGIMNKEAPIHVSNVMLFNEKIKDVTRAVYKTTTDGSRIRVCKKTGDEI